MRCSGMATGAAILLAGLLAGQQPVMAQTLLPSDDPSVLCPEGPHNCNPQAQGIRPFRVGLGFGYGLGTMSLASAEEAWGSLGQEPGTQMAGSLELSGGAQFQFSPRAFLQSGLVYGILGQGVGTTDDTFNARISYLGVPIEVISGAPRRRATPHLLAGIGFAALLQDRLVRNSDGEEFDLSDGLQSLTTSDGLGPCLQYEEGTGTCLLRGPAVPDEDLKKGPFAHLWVSAGFGVSFPIGPLRFMTAFRLSVAGTPLDVEGKLNVLRGNLQFSFWY